MTGRIPRAPATVGQAGLAAALAGVDAGPATTGMTNVIPTGLLRPPDNLPMVVGDPRARAVPAAAPRLATPRQRRAPRGAR